MKVKGGFTLIELMLVILIIGVLIGMLLPAISAATVFFKIKDTENRITLLSGYLEQYKQVFGDYPLSHETNCQAAPFGCNTTPRYPALTPSTWVNPGSGTLHYVDIVEDGVWNHDLLPRGGGFLYYFLMGPNQMGWSATDSNVNSCLSAPVVTPVFVSANWKAPNSLIKIVSSNLIVSSTNGLDANYATSWPHGMYFFEDGFGSAGYLQGTIQYSLRLSRSTYWPFTTTVIPTGTFYYEDVETAYIECGGTGGVTTDPSWTRLSNQCKTPYILLSAGPDRFFGYVITDPTTGLTRLVNSTDPNPSTNGVSDDITNFPHN